MTIGTDPNNRAVKIDLPRMIETRMLVQANSGAGKSWTLRRILEQTHGKAQQIVLDVEDEFYTLREKYDYVLAGRHGGDCPADVRSAALLARRLLELGVSAIVGIYELKFHDKIRFVKLFLDSLVSAPRDLWHPCLIVVDEAHIFAPQTGQAESASAVIDLMTRGRKRGFCGIIATQRISKLHKDAAAEANNKLIGRSSLDVDMKRAADELGFSSREDMLTLRNLQDGEFYAFGPAISNVVTQCKVGPVETTHPKAGQRAAPPPPPKDKVQKVLSQLADLPKEAEQEQASRMELQRRVRELETELRKSATPATAAADPERLKREFERGANSVKAALAKELRAYGRATAEVFARQDTLDALVSEMARYERVEHPTMPSLEAIIEQVKAEPVRAPLAMAAGAPASRPAAPRPMARTPRLAAESNGNSSLPKGESITLRAVAQYAEGIKRKQLSILTGYKRSTRDAYLQRLGEKGFVAESGDRVVATQEGVDALGPGFEPLPTGEELLNYWRAKLPEGERKILELLIEANGGPMDRDSLDERTGYARSSRDAYIQRLKSRQLVVDIGRGQVKASDELFG